MNVIAFSGGKDSTALVCWAIDQGMEFETVFCDTWWEHPETYAYIEYINQKLLKNRLITIRSEKYPGMLPMVKKKMRVPSAKARFCTEQLKVLPFIQWIKEQDEDIILYQGIRADESRARSLMPDSEWSDAYDCQIERPLFRWTAKECFALTKKHGIKPNPLYLKGARRVGCFPCVMITLGELKSLDITMPEVWDRMEEMEDAANGRSFFPPSYIPQRFHTGFDPKSGKTYPLIRDVKKYINDPNLKLFPAEPAACMSIYNLCE